jgi:energy-coupling factor transporter ATP-binding protein EcfA2
MQYLTKNPEGKIFAAKSFVGATRLDRLEILDRPLIGRDGPRLFKPEEIRAMGSAVFVVFQVPALFFFGSKICFDLRRWVYMLVHTQMSGRICCWRKYQQ